MKFVGHVTAPFVRVMNDSVTTRQYRNKTGILSNSFPITYDRDKTHFCNAVYTRSYTRQNCYGKITGSKIALEAKRGEKRGEGEQYGATLPPPPVSKIRLPRYDGVTFRLQLHRGFRIGRTCAPPGVCAPGVNPGKAPPCAGYVIHARLPVISSHRSLSCISRRSLFFPSLVPPAPPSLSLPISRNPRRRERG